MADAVIVTKDQCCTVLEKYLGTRDFAIINYSTDLMAEQYEGLIGEQYKLSIEYKFEDQATQQVFFMKILNGANSVMFDVAKSIDAFEKESSFYEKLIPLFQEEDVDTEFVPKCYLCEDYAIVLEDLSLTSYKGTTKSTPLSFEHCKKCLEIVAKLHTATIIYEDKTAEALGRKYEVTEDFEDVLTDRILTDEKNEGSQYFWCTFKGILDYCEYTGILENGNRKKKILQRLSDEMYKLMSSNKKKDTDFRSTVLHKDLWSNNFLFKYDNNNEVVDAKLIDFQTISHGSPAQDVMQFIFTNTRKDLRDKHVNDLLEHYYKFFNKFLVENNVEITDELSEVRFLESCEECKIHAKMLALFDRSITGISDIDFVKAAETEESFRNFLFENRGDAIIEAHKNNEGFREVMTEDITELVEMLCPTL